MENVFKKKNGPMQPQPLETPPGPLGNLDPKKQGKGGMFGNVIHHWGVRKAAILIVLCSEHQPMDCCLVVLKLEKQYFFYGEPLVGPTGWQTATSCVCARHIVCIYDFIYTHIASWVFFQVLTISSESSYLEVISQITVQLRDAVLLQPKQER